MTISPERSNNPELVFGLVAPIGVDLDLVTEVLTENLGEMHYEVESQSFRLTRLMREVPLPLPLRPKPYVRSIRDRIAYANEIRAQIGHEALAALAVSAIRSFRKEKREHLKTTCCVQANDAVRDDETPLPSQAYVIRQFKRPEEITLLRKIYGHQFILVSAYLPVEARRRRIAELERQSRGGLLSMIEAQNLANDLVAQDSREDLDKHGQNVRDAFPLGDVFIDASSRASCEKTLRRFINLFFGNNEITPTHDEYGMYLAKSASLRSSDLSRQVGAAIFRRSGEIVTLGCNEVPKAGGGTYWSDDKTDGRDFVQGHDSNELLKREILVDLISRLKNHKHLSDELQKVEDAHEVTKALLDDKSLDGVSESRLMDLIEFGRIIHAEMSAICDAARKGISVESTTLFCTTFPCHICAKHIVASGLQRVVFLEPYPKSYASELHRDSIAVENSSAPEKVLFEPFIGVSPYRYRELFEKGKRKYSGGLSQKWNNGIKRPMIEVYYPSYFRAETLLVGSLSGELKRIEEHAAKPETPGPVIADAKSAKTSPSVPPPDAGPEVA